MNTRSKILKLAAALIVVVGFSIVPMGRVSAAAAPALTLTKSADPVTYSQAGDSIAYTYILKNTGNVTLNPPFSVTDDKTTVSCPTWPAHLNQGASVVCTATYTITSADITAMSVTNTGNASATYNHLPVTAPPAPVTVKYIDVTLQKQIGTSASGPWSQSITVDPGTNVYYKFTVTNTGNAPLSPMTVTDPKIDMSGCTFTVPLGVGASTSCVVGPVTAESEPDTYINTATVHVGTASSGLNGQICYASSTNPVVTAKTVWSTDPITGNVTITATFSKNFVDNTYGTNAIGWPNGHKFSDLTGSDKLEFQLYDAGGTKVLDFYQDYISATTDKVTYPSGYASLGPFGGDGSWVSGTKSDVVSWDSSLSQNLNNNGLSYQTLTTNSPATDSNYTPNPTYPNWIYEVQYTVTVKGSAFPNGFGHVDIPFIHASPSKLGTNTVTVTEVPCGNSAPDSSESSASYTVQTQTNVCVDPVIKNVQYVGIQGPTKTMTTYITIQDATDGLASVTTFNLSNVGSWSTYDLADGQQAVDISQATGSYQDKPWGSYHFYIFPQPPNDGVIVTPVNTPFAYGTTAPVVVKAVSANPSVGGYIGVVATDTGGCALTFDPPSPSRIPGQNKSNIPGIGNGNGNGNGDK